MIHGSSIRVIDQDGREFASITDAVRHYGCEAFSSNASRGIRMRGFYECVSRGFSLRPIKGEKGVIREDEGESRGIAPPALSGALKAIAERYSEDELEMLAKGELHDKSLRYPKVHIHGEHHRIGVMSDTHIGSVYSPDEWIATALRDMEEAGCECVLHCGDLVEGLKTGRMGTQIYELSELGYKAQRDKAVALFSQSSLPIYCISGNHDYFFHENAGANIVEDICEKVENMTYLGHDQADIDVDGATIRLFHGGDGSSYAVSYRSQKLCESFPMGKKPDILLAGHVHKFDWCNWEGVKAISVPCLQMQSGWMRGRKLAAHCGYLILDFEVYDGRVCRLATELVPFEY